MRRTPAADRDRPGDLRGGDQDRLDDDLRHADRVRARLLRVGDLAGLEAMARYERGLRATTRVKRLRGDGTWLTVDIGAHMGHTEAEPLQVLRREGMLEWSAP